MILIVGDKPSKKNINPDVPFVGTTSYKRLLEWIVTLEVDITDVVTANREHIKTHPWAIKGEGEGVFIEREGIYADIMPEDKIIALGMNAAECLNDFGLDYCMLPHPSGLNRQNNDKKFIDRQLKKCKHWLNS